jgi:hypothetical protein
MAKKEELLAGLPNCRSHLSESPGAAVDGLLSLLAGSISAIGLELGEGCHEMGVRKAGGANERATDEVLGLAVESRREVAVVPLQNLVQPGGDEGFARHLLAVGAEADLDDLAELLIEHGGLVGGGPPYSSV